ncbi:hypothetical protein N7495_000802 [Penicillium taxi]|uniref:uncharacterized protein n=1 Tax=Penicillium taxi TaxID=168475 RepID=UPI0025458104|nr:uncharacterized protein N7495_000802 [Penicillium taxi]KAJ5908120.1 hypothetical protein N7495_000802 [Penicillium taxi]
MGEEEQRCLAVQIVAAVLMPIAVISVLLRCYVRLVIVKAFGWDDGTMVLAMLCYVMFCACEIGGTRYGTGYKFENIEPADGVVAMKYWWLCEIAYCFASVFCKISVCVFLMRITIKRIHIWILYLAMVFTCIAGLIFMFLMLLQCHPISYFWNRVFQDPTIPGYCISIDVIITMTYVYSAFSAMCDFTVGILPIFLVKSLHMKKQAKLAIIGILSMACIASCAVIIRIPFVKTFRSSNFLFSTYQIAIWSNAEAALGITAGSLATLRPLLRHWLGTNNDSDHESGFPRTGHSYPFGGSNQNRGMPLSSMDGTKTGNPGLRPDMLAVLTTNVEGRRKTADVNWTSTSSSNSSEEALTSVKTHRNRIEVGVHQTFEVTQSAADRDVVEGGSYPLSGREHV